MLVWTILFALFTLFCTWVVFGDGAESAQGMFSAYLLGESPGSSEMAIRLAIGIGWLASLVWYSHTILGLNFF